MTGSDKLLYHVLDMGFGSAYAEILEGLSAGCGPELLSVVLLKCTGHYLYDFPHDSPLVTGNPQSFMPGFDSALILPD